MSLRFQISIRILFFSLLIIMLGGGIALWQARNAVTVELESSINLALQLVKLSLPSAQTPRSEETAWMYHLSALEQTRHLTIKLRQPSGEIIDIPHSKSATNASELPPRWFVRLVTTDYPTVEQQIPGHGEPAFTLIIQANPLDEISEVWQETVSFFAVLIALILLTFLAVNLVFHKTFKAINTIVANVQLIETGEYRRKLPDFSTREYDSIAKAINHMTTVLETTRQQNRALTQHSLTIQEEERQRLSQELHDEFGQSLTALKVMAVTAAHERSDTRRITESMIEVCDHLMTVVRTMMQQLHPLILTELGLKATLEDVVNHWSEKYPELVLTLQCDEVVDMLDKKVTIQVFRIVQECLTNIVRHAQATQATISLQMTETELEIEIADNGQGCDIARVSSGFGLMGMRERIKSLDGRLELRSQPGAGMTINAIIPL